MDIETGNVFKREKQEATHAKEGKKVISHFLVVFGAYFGAKN
jgi:hypothetical protein